MNVWIVNINDVIMIYNWVTPLLEIISKKIDYLNVVYTHLPPLGIEKLFPFEDNAS
jgi:hypothetical protein